MRRLLLFLIFLNISCKKPLEFKELPIGGDIELISQDGVRERLSQSFKPATLLFFGFTRCPDFCPTLLHRLKTALIKNPQLREKTRLLFVSIDSSREKPGDLKTFLAPFAFAKGFTAGAAEIAATEKLFGAHSGSSQSGLSHSLYLYVINRNGKVIYLLRHDDSSEKIVQALEQASTL